MSVAQLPRVILLHNHDNSWTPADLLEVEQDHRRALGALQASSYDVVSVKVYDSVAAALQATQCNPREWIVFNWCEGYADRPWDYHGVADELDQLHYVYTGATAWTLRLSSDKSLVRTALIEAGVPVPLSCVTGSPSGLKWQNYPAIVKATNQHGSYGIDHDAVVDDAQQLQQRVEYVVNKFNSPALIEEFVDGREFQVTVWGNTEPEVLPSVEVVFAGARAARDRVYTYEIKFDANAPVNYNVSFVCPAMLTPELRQRLAQVSVQAYHAMHCRDYARVDLRVRDEEPLVIDVNPNPDINSESLMIIAAEVTGLTYDQVVTRIAAFAAERWRIARESE